VAVAYPSHPLGSASGNNGSKTTIQQTTEFIRIQQRDKELESMNKDAILKQEPRARETAYLNQPAYLKKIDWSGVRLLSLSETYYPPRGDYTGEPNQS
jgi:hypothetical protein